MLVEHVFILNFQCIVQSAQYLPVYYESQDLHLTDFSSGIEVREIFDHVLYFRTLLPGTLATLKRDREWTGYRGKTRRKKELEKHGVCEKSVKVE